MRDYRKYNVWEMGHKITLDVYKMTKGFPKDEIYGIPSQMRRASYAIPLNIAEGCGREPDAEFKRFLIISQGSASELEFFSFLVKDLGYISDSVYQEINEKINKVKRSLHSLISKI
ncbi:MAG: four helix bundle protein [Flavobacteriaceae bacterium]